MFLSSIKASAGDRSPWGSFWFQPIGMRSISGMRVTADSAMRLSAVYSCVRVLSETFAVLPFRLYQRRGDGSRSLVRDHWLYRLLAKHPNEWQTPFEWREMMMGHLALRGNAFNVIVANGAGVIEQLLPIHPDRIKIEVMDSGNYRYLVTQQDGTTQPYARGDIWHIRGLSSDGIIGLNPIQIAADVLGLGIAAQNYGARFFANDAKPGGWIEMPGKFADEETKQTFKESWAKSQSGANRGKTAILELGMKYHELALNNSDAQFLESRKFSRSEIASIYRVPPHKIGDLDRATFSNIEQQSLEFVMDTMTPWAERWESSIETFLLFDSDELEVEFDFANLLRGDSQARATYYNKRFNMGSMSPNDIRIREGEQPIPEGNKYFIPANMISLSAAGQPQVKKGVRPAPQPEPDTEPPEDGDEETNPAEESAGARMQALALAAAARVARREAAVLAPLAATLPLPVDKIGAAMRKHAEFVSDALGVSIQSARAYIEARRADPIHVGSVEQDIHAAALQKLERLALKGHL